MFTPALIYSIGIGSLKPVLLLTALSLGFSDAASSAVVGVFGIVIGPLFYTLLLSMWFIGTIYAFGILTTAIALVFISLFLAPDAPSCDPGLEQSAEPSQENVEHISSPRDGDSDESSDEKDRSEKVVPSPFATVVMGVGLNALAVLRANRDVIVPL